jgi:hypothetical protein
VHSELTKRTALAAGGGVAAAPVALARVFGEGTFLQCVSVVVLALGVAFAVGLVNHIWAWRLRRKPNPGVPATVLACLDRLLALQVPLAVLWLGAGSFLVADPGATVPVLPLAIPWLSVLLLVLTPWVMITLSGTSRLAQRAGLPFVTEMVRASRGAALVSTIVDPFERVLLLVPLRKWLSRTETPGLVSGFSVFLLSALLFLSVEATYGVAAHRLIGAAAARFLAPDAGEGRISGPTYEELCPGGKQPGRPAPEPWGSLLYALWLGNEWVEGAGAIEAGCAQTARRARGHPNLWLAYGVCGGARRSLGLADPHGTLSLLYQEAARFASAQERAGRLRGASPRIDVASGDLYLVHTTTGTYALVRSRKARGSTAATRAPRRCEDYTSENYPYTRVPPGLVWLWLSIAEDEWVWPELDTGSDPSGHRFAFVGEEGGGVVAHAYCSSDLRCEATFDRRELSTPESLAVTVDAVRAVAPGG